MIFLFDGSESLSTRSPDRFPFLVIAGLCLFTVGIYQPTGDGAEADDMDGLLIAGVEVETLCREVLGVDAKRQDGPVDCVVWHDIFFEGHQIGSLGCGVHRDQQTAAQRIKEYAVRLPINIPLLEYRDGKLDSTRLATRLPAARFCHVLVDNSVYFISTKDGIGPDEAVVWDPFTVADKIAAAASLPGRGIDRAKVVPTPLILTFEIGYGRVRAIRTEPETTTGIAGLYESNAVPGFPYRVVYATDRCVFSDPIDIDQKTYDRQYQDDLAAAAEKHRRELEEKQKCEPKLLSFVAENIEKKYSNDLQEAIRTLAEIRSKKAVDVLPALIDQTPSSKIRYEAILALGKIGSSKSIPLLRELASGKRVRPGGDMTSTQRAAVEALSEIAVGDIAAFLIEKVAGNDALPKIVRQEAKSKADQMILQNEETINNDHGKEKEESNL